MLSIPGQLGQPQLVHLPWRQNLRFSDCVQSVVRAWYDSQNECVELLMARQNPIQEFSLSFPKLTTTRSNFCRWLLYTVIAYANWSGYCVRLCL